MQILLKKMKKEKSKQNIANTYMSLENAKNPKIIFYLIILRILSTWTMSPSVKLPKYCYVKHINRGSTSN